MARARDLRVTISGDSRGLSRGTRQAERDVNRLQRVTTSSSGRMTAAFKGTGAAIAGAFAVSKLIGFGKVAVETATDVQESLSKNRVLFGKYAQDVDKFTKTSATSFGISRAAALDATGTFGNLFNAVGVGPQKAARLSVSLTKLAADMASFNNASPEEALEAIRSGLVGETEPLRKFGVNLNDATMRQQAMAMGLTHSTKNVLTPYQKALAAQALVVKQTSAAHGDFKRTSGGLANQQRILKAEVSDLSAEAGKVLLPALTSVARKTTDFIKGMREGTGAGGRFAQKARDIANAVKPVAKFFADHPKLIAAAVAAWATYRTAALAATAVTRLKLIGTFTGLGAPAARGGAVAGRAFGASVMTTSGTVLGAGGAGGRWSRLGKGIGGVLGKAAGAAMVVGLGLAVREWAKSNPALGQYSGSKGWGELGRDIADLLPGEDSESKRARKRAKMPTATSGPTRLPAPRTPGRRGPRRTPLGQSHASVARFRGSVPASMAGGNTRSMMRARGPVAVASGAQPHPDDIVAAIEERADRIDAAHVPYLWGGGHGGKWSGGRVIPMDCSGAVSAALGIDPRVSGQFASWGSPGDGGNRGVTVYANSTHVLMKINGRFWGTSRSNPGGGPGWIDGGVSPGYLSGFTARHLGGTKGSSAAASLGRSGSGARRRAKPKRLTASLGGTVERRAPRTATRPWKRVPGVERGMGYGLPTREQIDLLSSDNPVMRQFQIGSRINEIDRLLMSGRVVGADADQLLDERRSLKSELGDLLKPPDTSSDSPADSGEDPNQALIDALARQTDAENEHTAALKALQDAVDEQNKFASSIAATGLAAAQRALADMISRQLGAIVNQRNATPGFAGARARY